MTVESLDLMAVSAVPEAVDVPLFFTDIGGDDKTRTALANKESAQATVSGDYEAIQMIDMDYSSPNNRRAMPSPATNRTMASWRGESHLRTHIPRTINT